MILETHSTSLFRESDRVHVYYHGVCLPGCPDDCRDCAKERQSFVVIIGDEFKGRKSKYCLNFVMCVFWDTHQFSHRTTHIHTYTHIPNKHTKPTMMECGCVLTLADVGNIMLRGNDKSARDMALRVLKSHKQWKSPAGVYSSATGQEYDIQAYDHMTAPFWEMFDSPDGLPFHVFQLAWLALIILPPPGAYICTHKPGTSTVDVREHDNFIKTQEVVAKMICRGLAKCGNVRSLSDNVVQVVMGLEAQMSVCACI